MSDRHNFSVRFHSPPPDLRRYFTTFYLIELTVADGEVVTDSLQPEWANLRFLSGPGRFTGTIGRYHLESGRFVATGPSSLAARFSIGSNRIWGLGLLPLGWAKFVRASADTLANSVVDGDQHPDFASFRPLADTLFAGPPDEDAELARIEQHFRSRIEAPVHDKARIVAVHAALVEGQIRTVTELAAAAGLSQRTLERVCERAFGFSPKLLLRRQRFLRSLAHYMMDPSLTWIGAIDDQYYDQAQFVRDFRQFMGMSPRQYDAMPRPILDAMMAARNAFAGKAVQALDGPEGVQVRPRATP